MAIPSRSCFRFTSFAVAMLLITCAAAQRPSLRGTSRSNPASSERDSSDSPRKKNEAFSVESFSPRGPVTPGAVISVTFNADVITSEALESGDTPKSVFSFEPPIEGTMQWEPLRHARYVPRKPLAAATEYTARINPLLRNASGIQLKEPEEFHFQTPPLSLRSATQHNFYSDQRVSIKLTFSDPVTPHELRKYLTLKSGDNIVRWQPESTAATDQPIIVTDPMSTDALRLILEPGLKGTQGSLGITNRIEQKIRLNFRLVATQLKGRWDNGRPILRVQFSDSPRVYEAAKRVKVEPPVKISHFNNIDNFLDIYGEFEAEKRYTVTIDKGFTGSGEKVLLEPVTLSAFMPPMTAFLELPEAGGGYLGTKGRMKLRVRTAAVNILKVIARRVYDNNMIHNGSSTTWYDVARTGKKVAEKTYDLKMEPNKPLVTEIDLRDLLGPQPAGIYGFYITGETPLKDDGTMDSDGHWDSGYYRRSSLEDTVVINLSNLGIVAKTAPREVMVFVAALDTALPVAGVNVTLHSDKYQVIGEGVTDALGMYTFRDIPEDDKDVSPQAIVAHTSGSKEISMIGLYGNLAHMEEFENLGRDYLRSGYEAFITPERGAYRPGETAHISGFVRGRDASPPASAFPVEVVLERPDGKKLTPEVKTPTATGLLQFDMTIPAYAPTGYYNVEVRMPGTGNDEDTEDEDY